jgi:hypothetical protein
MAELWGQSPTQALGAITFLALAELRRSGKVSKAYMKIVAGCEIP